MPIDFVKVVDCDALKPGKMRCVVVAGRKILLANVNGQYYAADDTCTHEDASLATGSLKGEFVKCPLHGSRFNVCTGAVLDEPAEENLKTYPVRQDSDGIYVSVT